MSGISQHAGAGARFTLVGALNSAGTVALYQALVTIWNPITAYAVAWLAGIAFVALVYPSAVYRAHVTPSVRLRLVLLYSCLFVAGLLSTQILDLAGVHPRLIVFIVAAATAVLGYCGGHVIVRAP
jgi:putative flippase GtrA